MDKIQALEKEISGRKTPVITHFRQACYKCRYPLEVYLAKTESAIMLGFKNKATIQCLCCKTLNDIMEEIE